MKTSAIAVLLLAGIAGTSGLLIGMARARHVAASAPPAGRGATTMAATTSRRAAPDDSDPVEVIEFASNPLPAPPFLVNDLSGNIISTPQLHGKVVIVNFWATWCPPCREEIPQLTALASQYKDRLVIIGVAMDDDASPAEVRAFAARMGINYPVVMGSQTIAAEYGGVPALPTSFIIDTNGRVVQKHVGLNPPGLFETEVRALLGMPISAKVETFQDTGQIFLKNAALATELPGVDLSGLTPAQKAAVLKRLNSETCTCGCALTLAQCRINDTSCPISTKLAAKVVQEVKSGSSHAIHAASTAN